MPRSSRHKSSKHSSREAREYSDSEKELNLKDRKGKEESGGGARVSKESEKRKVDSTKDAKDLHGSGNGDYSEEHGSSKRRRERAGDGVSDRWNGGEDDRTEVSKKLKESKASGELKSGSSSRRREEGVGMYVEGEEGKKSSGKHRDSGRKEGKEGVVEREKKSKEVKSERSVIDNDEHRETKKTVENTGKVTGWFVS